jgi:hypothetical protein
MDDRRNPVSHAHWPDVHPPRPRSILLSDVFGVSVLVGARRRAASQGRSSPTMPQMVRSPSLSSLPLAPSSSLTPPAASTAVLLGKSIASEGKGEYMYVEGHVLTTSDEPALGAAIETWETDDKGD